MSFFASVKINDHFANIGEEQKRTKRPSNKIKVKERVEKSSLSKPMLILPKLVRNRTET